MTTWTISSCEPATSSVFAFLQSHAQFQNLVNEALDLSRVKQVLVFNDSRTPNTYEFRPFQELVSELDAEAAARMANFFRRRIREQMGVVLRTIQGDGRVLVEFAWIYIGCSAMEFAMVAEFERLVAQLTDEEFTRRFG